jgi:chromosome segregation ATPase
LSAALEELKRTSQQSQLSNDKDIQRLTKSVKDLEAQLLTTQDSEASLSQRLQVAMRNEEEIRQSLKQITEDSQPIAKEAERLSSVVKTLQAELAGERTSHSDAIAMLKNSYENEIASLQTEIEQSRECLLTLRTGHADTTRDLTQKLEEAQARLEAVNGAVLSCESLESDIRRLKSEHAEELLILHSRLHESNSEADILQEQLRIVTDTVAELESEIEALGSHYEAAQAEARDLEHALSQARLQMEERDDSIRTLQREKSTIESELKRLDAELDKITVKYQFSEQQVKRRYGFFSKRMA